MPTRIPGALSKWEGLLRLEAASLPHPEWRFVRGRRDLPEEAWAEAPHGWTIRTCTTSGYYIGLPSVHWLPFEELAAAIEGTAFECYQGEVFVVYPSWHSLFGGVCDITVGHLEIEAVKGDIGPLLRGERSPDARWVWNGPYYGVVEMAYDPLRLGPDDMVKAIAGLMRRVEVTKETLIEWTETTESVLYFHDWLELT